MDRHAGPLPSDDLKAYGSRSRKKLINLLYRAKSMIPRFWIERSYGLLPHAIDLQLKIEIILPTKKFLEEIKFASSKKLNGD